MCVRACVRAQKKVILFRSHIYHHHLKIIIKTYYHLAFIIHSDFISVHLYLFYSYFTIIILLFLLPRSSLVAEAFRNPSAPASYYLNIFHIYFISFFHSIQFHVIEILIESVYSKQFSLFSCQTDIIIVVNYVLFVM